MSMDSDHQWQIDPSKPPQNLEFRLSAETAQQIKDLSERTGRSEDEVILDLLDRGLQNL